MTLKTVFYSFSLVIATRWCPLMAQVDQQLAATYFKEVEILCEKEGGRLWGTTLWGPMVMADATTGTIATNLPAPDAPRPRALGYANAAMKWGDERWSTFVWKMVPAEDHRARTQLLIHELFHRIQPEIGFFIPTSKSESHHLDQPEGRYWVQLEWRALTKALKSQGDNRKKALSDAFAFRRARRDLHADAAENERISEINEGLAQYTATVVAAPTPEEAVADAIAQLTKAPEKESFVRTFSYPIGAAYGVLLDKYSPGWTKNLTSSDDLGALLKQAAHIGIAKDAKGAAKAYGGEKLWQTEQARYQKRMARIAQLKARFVEGPVVVIPRGRGASFITTGVTPIPGEGTLYPQYRVKGEWGSIQADSVLRSTDGQSLRVPGPPTTKGNQVTGEGWTATLSPGWTLKEGKRKGDFQC